MSQFPTSIPAFTDLISSETLAANNHTLRHNTVHTELAAVATKVGINGSADTNSLDYKIGSLATAVAAIQAAQPTYATKTGSETLTNKTITAPAVSDPTITGGGSWAGSPLITTPTIDTPVFQGTVSGWINASETWTYASASTITVPSNATLKYNVGDYIMLTQSSTVKYFAITIVASTLLTVAGLLGVTVANSTISANAYSPCVPLGAPAGPHYNPYAWSVWLNTPVAITNQSLKILFDHAEFDNSNNFDLATNHRATITVPGKYHIDAQAEIGSAGMGGNEGAYISVYKNGSEILRSQQDNGSGDSTKIVRPTISKLIMVVATDYLEIFATQIGSRGISAGETVTWFSGFLVTPA